MKTSMEANKQGFKLTKEKKLSTISTLIQVVTVIAMVASLVVQAFFPLSIVPAVLRYFIVFASVVVVIFDFILKTEFLMTTTHIMWVAIWMLIASQH